MSEQPILKLSALGKRYAQCWVVQNLNLQIARGEIYGFLGRNGAGKTTTIRMIMNLIRPTAGEIILFGKAKPELNAEIFQRISATIEYPGFYLNLTARENLLYYAKLRNVASSKVDELLDFFALRGAARRLTKEFSLGMKQRLGLARALLHDPELLILDEPTNGLDPAGIQEIRETLKRLNRAREITILFSSHSLSQVEQTASKVGIIHQGTLVDEFTLDQFKHENQQFIQVSVSDPARALELLSSKYQLTPQLLRPGLIRIPKPSAPPEEINRFFIENGIDVSSLNIFSETLEDRFLRLTGGKEHA